MNQIKIGAVLSYASLILSMAITLIYTPILVKNLGQAEYGVYSLMAAFVGYLTILDMGLGNAIVRYVARTRANNDRQQEAKLSGMFLILFTLLGVLVTIVGIIMYYQIDLLFGSKLASGELALAKTMAIILVANFAMSFPLSVFGAIVQAHERFVFLKLTNIIRTVITPLIIVPLLFLGHGSIMVVTITSVFNILFLLLNVWYCFKKLNVRVKFEKFDKPLVKEILIYSSFIFLNAIMDKIYWSTDQIILGAVNGANQVAIYAIAMQFIMVYMSMSTAIGGLFLPKVSVMEMNGASNKEFSDLFLKVGRIQSFIMVTILFCFYIVGERFLTLWIGEGYIATYKIVLIIMVPLSIILCQNIGISILQAKNLHAFRSIVYIILALANVIISIPLAKIYGVHGVALVTGISLIIGHLFIMNTYYKLKLHIDIRVFWNNILSLILVNGVATITTILIINLFTISDFATVIVSLVIYGVCYLVLVITFILTELEKKWIFKYLSKVQLKSK